MLLEVKEKHRIETLYDVENFHELLKAEAKEQNYNLSSFSYKEKTKKQKGEIIDQWMEVSITKIINEGV